MSTNKYKSSGFILKIAWRNIWRNKLRSSIVMFAVTIGLFGGLAATGIMKGMVVDMLKNSLENQTSHIQIHNKEFKANNEVIFTINNTDKIISDIKKIDEVKAVCQRTKTFGMASTASTAVGIMLNGIVPQEEKQVTKIYEKLIDDKSKYFESGKKNRIIISEALAKKLNVRLKSKIIITFQDYDGNLTGASFKVEGIYKTQNAMFDNQTVFVKKSDLDRLLNLPVNSAHEIALILNDYKQTSAIIPQIEKITPDYLVESWFTIDPYLKLTSSMTDYMLYIFMSIIMLALGFTIVNTMLMVILERTKELGMIMAIGMNRRKIFKMIFYETTLLALTGAVIGIVISYVFTVYFGQAGIDISSVGKGFAALGYDSVMYPVLNFTDYVNVIILVLITGFIASIFPTIRALKMNPAEAVRM